MVKAGAGAGRSTPGVQSPRKHARSTGVCVGGSMAASDGCRWNVQPSVNVSLFFGFLSVGMAL